MSNTRPWSRQPRKRGNRMRCAEELIGRNSVMPWTMARTTACSGVNDPSPPPRPAWAVRRRILPAAERGSAADAGRRRTRGRTSRTPRAPRYHGVTFQTVASLARNLLPWPSPGSRGMRTSRRTPSPATVEPLQPVRRERLIASCRVALAVLALLAVWIDPTEPTRLVGFTYWLLASYVLFSAALAQWTWTARSTPAILPLLVHGLDLGIFFLLIVVTSGGDSPFFVFLVFALVAATLRWHAVGTFWTGLAALAAFLGAGVIAERLDPASGFEINRFIIRNIYLVVLAVLLGYVGHYERRLREKVAALGERPPILPTEVDELVRSLLEHAAKVLQAPITALVWEEEEEPWSNLAIWSGTALAWHRGAPGSLDPLAPEDLAERPFVVAGS